MMEDYADKYEKAIEGMKRQKRVIKGNSRQSGVFWAFVFPLGNLGILVFVCL